MFRKIALSTLLVILVATVAVGAYDVFRGESTLNTALANSFEPDEDGLAFDAQIEVTPMAAQAHHGQTGDMPSDQAQTHGPQGHGDQVDPATGQMSHGTPGEGVVMPERDWQTLHGSVVSFDGLNLTVDTVEDGPQTYNLGNAGFVSEQNITFAVGDEVTVLGFDENGVFQVGQVNNDTTQAVLLLRDPNGRPLWAGPGRNAQGGGQGGHSADGGQGHGTAGGQGGQGQMMHSETDAAGQGGQGNAWGRQGNTNQTDTTATQGKGWGAQR